MRHIFIAAVSTLAVITALLSLPPVGEPHAQLMAQTIGDRTAVVTADAPETTETTSVLGADIEAPRTLVTPSDTPVVSGGLALAGDELLAAPGLAPVNPADRLPNVSPTPATSSTTIAPTTTTTTPTTTTTTTTSTVPASDAPQTVSDPGEGDGGVIISPRGVVLPIIGPSEAEGWRVTTPCGNEVTVTDGQRVSSVDWVLDPGHGGSESGAVGPNGAREKDLNVRIAEITKWYLEEAGYSVLLTRTTDIRIPLRSRAEMANAVDPIAFISIHHNGGATRRQSTPGTEMFVDGGNPEARRLGGILFEELVGRLSNYEADWVGTWRNGVSTRYNSSGEDLYGIHRYTPGVPSVITEAGYLSNASEAALFVDNDVQWAHGRAIAEGLMRWHRTSDAGSGYLEDFVDDSSSGTGGFTGCEDPAL